MNQFQTLVTRSLLLFALSCPIFGQLTSSPQGKIDRSFGKNGFAYIDSETSDDPNLLVDTGLLPDGKIVTLNLVQRVGLQGISVARLLDDGKPDPTFGDNGIVSIFGTGHLQGFTLLPLPNGKLLIAGESQTNSQTGSDFLLIRLSADGKLDTTFASGGMFVKDFAVPGEKSDDRIGSLAVQPDGKIIAAGICDQYVSLGRAKTYASIMRLSEDGEIDSDFGENGSSLIFVGNNLTNVIDSLYDTKVTLQNDSKILVGITARKYFSDSVNDFSFPASLMRLTNDGTLDVSFANKGIVESGGFISGFYALVQLPDFKILTLTGLGIMTRINADGTLDSNFGSNGRINVANGWRPTDLAVNDESKIFVVGLRVESNQNGQNLNFGMVARYFADGEQDIRFGHAGLASLDLGTGSDGFSRLQIYHNRFLLVGGTLSQKPFVARLFGTRQY